MLGAETQQPNGPDQDTNPSDTTRAPDYEVEATDAKNRTEWLKLFLKANAFLRLPAANLHALVARMEEVPIKAGRIIIHQGANANNYYIIKEGSCRVVRQLQGSAEPLDLALLSAGDGFGEDALITRGRRNASVVALENGCLMRLSRHNFTTLLVSPLLSPVVYPHALTLAAEGAVLLDVRSPQEYRRGNIEGSINIPLPLLRANLARLDPATDYIIYCNSGNFSAAAAFLLAQRGLRAHILAGGLKQIPGWNQEHGNVLSAVARVAAPPASRTNHKRTDAQSSSTRQTNHAAGTTATSPPVQPVDARSPERASAKESDVPQKQPAPRNTTIVCVERDDAQLWTPIPVAPALKDLRIVEDTKPTAVRNDSLRCLETEGDMIWAESQMLLSQAKSLMGQALPLSPQPPTPAAAEVMAAVATTPDKPQTSQVELGWISDSYLWENALGYRHDPAVTSLIGDTATSVLTLQDSRAEAHGKEAKRTAISGSIATSLTTSPGASPNLAEAVEQARALTAARQRNRHLSMWTAALLVLAAAFWGSQQAGVSPIVARWLEPTLSELARLVPGIIPSQRSQPGSDMTRLEAAATQRSSAPTRPDSHEERPVQAAQPDKHRAPAAPEVSLF